MAGGVALGAVTPRLLNAQSETSQVTNSSSPPNILIILVDQWRSPIWFPDPTTLAELLPATTALFSQSVDFTNYFTAATACSPGAGSTRTQLCSSVDVIGLLLSLATGGEMWRNAYPYLANRGPMAKISQDPTTSGRNYVLHTTDEPWVPETNPNNRFDADVPLHVIGYRTSVAKLGLYSFWRDGTIDIATNGHELEFYDYGTNEGIIETKSKPGSALQYYQTLTAEVIPNELRQPLPASLQPFQQQAIQGYLAFLNTLKT